MARRGASMREGPLAELFRATEAAQRQSDKEGESASSEAPDPDATVESAVPFAEPEFGSENPWHHAISPLRILGRNSFFCSSVPHWRMVGPTRVSPKKSARRGALARANSSASTTFSIVERPFPPYSGGHAAQIHPPS